MGAPPARGADGHGDSYSGSGSDSNGDGDKEDELLSYGSPRTRFSQSRSGGVAKPKAATGPGGGDGGGDDAVDGGGDGLLAYYRDRCAQFQAEREKVLERMAQVEGPQELLHRAQWDIKMRTQEIAELEKALARANASVFELKEQNLALTTENQSLRLQEETDRRKIQHLLALTQPVVEEVSFMHDRRPGISAAYPVQQQHRQGLRTYEYSSTMFIDSEAKAKAKAQASAKANAKATVAATATTTDRELSTSGLVSSRYGRRVATPHKVLRTVYMPNEQADAQARSIELLKEQLSKQRALAEERLEHVLDAHASEMAKLRQEHKVLSESNTLISKELTKTQRLLTKTTKDYLVLRHQSQEAERLAHEELHTARTQCDQLRNDKSTVTQQARELAAAVKQKAREESVLCEQELRDQAVARERDLHILREQYAALQQACNQRIQDLETRLAKLRTRYRSLDKRRTMEMEGFSHDILALKRHTQRLEGMVYGRRVVATGVRRTRAAAQAPGVSLLDSKELNDEIATLKRRVADLAADVEGS